MFFRTGEPTLLDRATDKAIRALDNHQIGSQDYVKTLDSVIKLHKMKEEEKPSSVSRDTLIIAGTNLLGIIMIIRHEHVNVIASKAMNLVLKPR
jgi:hypothetical protein